MAKPLGSVKELTKSSRADQTIIIYFKSELTIPQKSLSSFERVLVHCFFLFKEFFGGMSDRMAEIFFSYLRQWRKKVLLGQEDLALVSIEAIYPWDQNKENCCERRTNENDGVG